MNPIESNAHKLLSLMTNQGRHLFENDWLQIESGLSPQDINDAVSYLVDIGAIRPLKTMGTAPFHFKAVRLESRGRFIYNEIKEKDKKEQDKEDNHNQINELPSRPYNPIGSPYGFTDYDWEEVSLRKEDTETIFVVLGMQFESKIYDRQLFIKNMEEHFSVAVKQYNENHSKESQFKPIKLQFEPLKAGLGEHLFNEIARNIIGADIALFETSDQNPNVMLEMGVALTWGVRVIPIKEKSCPKPPSDISGQTWVNHENSGEIMEAEFEKRLVKIIERIRRRKGRH